jgi:protein arginine N-methyltransferase 1
VSLVEAPRVYNELTTPWDYPYGLSMGKIKQIVVNDWSEEGTDTFSKNNLLMEPLIWTVLDYASIESPDVVPSTLHQKAARDGTAHGLLLWFDGEIADGLHIYNGPGAEKVAKVYGCAFFPLLEPVTITRGDAITLDIRTELSKGHYNWRWHTRILGGENTQVIKADFAQATDLDHTLERAVLHKSILNFRPSRGEAGELDHFILGKMDGRHSIDQIARQALGKYPDRFETENEAQLYINALSQEYGH